MTATKDVFAFNKGSGSVIGAACRCGGAGHQSTTATLTATLQRLWNTLVEVRGYVDALAVVKGLAVEVPDEPVGRQYAVPQSPWATLEEAGPDQDGAARGDERIDRRRRALELERLILIARKKRNGASIPDKLKWDAELQELSSELEQIHQQERAERSAMDV